MGRLFALKRRAIQGDNAERLSQTAFKERAIKALVHLKSLHGGPCFGVQRAGDRAVVGEPRFQRPLQCRYPFGRVFLRADGFKPNPFTDWFGHRARLIAKNRRRRFRSIGGCDAGRDKHLFFNDPRPGGWGCAGKTLAGYRGLNLTFRDEIDDGGRGHRNVNRGGGCAACNAGNKGSGERDYWSHVAALPYHLQRCYPQLRHSKMHFLATAQNLVQGVAAFPHMMTRFCDWS